MISHVPHIINEVHFLVDKLKHGIPVKREEAREIFKNVYADRDNYGIWIKREIDEHTGQDYMSYVAIWQDKTGKMRIIGHKIERSIKRVYKSL